jgi:hypothetical protein
MQNEQKKQGRCSKSSEKIADVFALKAELSKHTTERGYKNNNFFKNFFRYDDITNQRSF